MRGNEMIDIITKEQKDYLIKLLKSTERELTDNLNSFTEKNFTICIKNSDFKKFSEISEIFGNSKESEIAAVLLLALNGIKGYMLLIFPINSAKIFINTLIEREENEFDNWSDMEISTLCETANIFGTTFTNKIGEQINKTITTTKPHFAINYFNAIIEELLIEYAELGDKILIIEMNFKEKELDFEGYFFFIPSPESLPVLLGIK